MNTVREPRRKMPILLKWILRASLICTPVPVAAHHHVGTVDDLTKVVTLNGVVTRVQWTNPHVLFFLDVNDGNGAQVHWLVEVGSPNSLMRHGVTKDSFPSGVEMKVDVWVAKDGSKHADAKYGTIVTMSNGVTFPVPYWSPSGKSFLVRPGPPKN